MLINSSCPAIHKPANTTMATATTLKQQTPTTKTIKTKATMIKVKNTLTNSMAASIKIMRSTKGEAATMMTRK